VSLVSNSASLSRLVGDDRTQAARQDHRVRPVTGWSRVPPVSRHDFVIVGAGLVGLGTALALVRRYPGADILVIDKAAKVAAHQSSHNSGVVHSGLYYKPGSQRAELCRRGRSQLLQFAAEEGVPVLGSGKLVVAVSSREIDGLRKLAERGTANRLVGLELLDPTGIRAHEPGVAGLLGLWVPETALVDYGQIAAALERRLVRLGVRFRLGCEVLGVRDLGASVEVQSAGGVVISRRLVNCGGLQAELLARAAGVHTGLRIVPFRGDYFTLRSGAADQVRGAVYPVADARLPFLGVHLTRHVTGEVSAGPNAVLALAREGYRRRDVDPAHVASLLAYSGVRRLARRYLRVGIEEEWRDLSRRAYARAVARYLPGLTHRDLRSGPSGVRAQAVTPDGSLLDDFAIVCAGATVHVLNAPSPAATACLAIGEEIAGKVSALVA
jgi:L-2-hydroxyglutarate oxidase LhgO